MGVSELFEEDYAIKLSLTKQNLAAVFAEAQAQHHEFELNKLNNVHDAVWAGFYAAYALGKLGDFAKPTELATWLEEPTPKDAVWATAASDNVAVHAKAKIVEPTRWTDDEYSIPPKLTKENLAAAFAGAQERHHEFEENKLGNVRDAVWFGFYAAYALGQFGNFAKPTELATWLEEPTAEGKPWAEGAADNVLKHVAAAKAAPKPAK